MTKQLKAIIETRENVEQEARDGKEFHRWNIINCPLCIAFPNVWCIGCPMKEKDLTGCVDFFQDLGFENIIIIPIEYILSFLIDLESCYRDMEGA